MAGLYVTNVIPLLQLNLLGLPALVMWQVAVCLGLLLFIARKPEGLEHLFQLDKCFLEGPFVFQLCRLRL